MKTYFTPPRKKMKNSPNVLLRLCFGAFARTDSCDRWMRAKEGCLLVHGVLLLAATPPKAWSRGFVGAIA